MRYLLALLASAALMSIPYVTVRYGIELDEGTLYLIAFTLLPLGLMLWRSRLRYVLRGLNEMKGGYSRNTLATVNRRYREKAGFGCVYTFTTTEAGRVTARRRAQYELLKAEKGDHIMVTYWPQDPKVHAIKDALEADIYARELDIRSLGRYIPVLLAFALVLFAARVARLYGWL